jgi:hypothetical protein
METLASGGFQKTVLAESIAARNTGNVSTEGGCQERMASEVQGCAGILASQTITAQSPPTEYRHQGAGRHANQDSGVWGHDQRSRGDDSAALCPVAQPATAAAAPGEGGSQMQWGQQEAPPTDVTRQ